MRGSRDDLHLLRKDGSCLLLLWDRPQLWRERPRWHNRGGKEVFQGRWNRSCGNHWWLSRWKRLRRCKCVFCRVQNRLQSLQQLFVDQRNVWSGDLILIERWWGALSLTEGTIRHFLHGENLAVDLGRRVSTVTAAVFGKQGNLLQCAIKDFLKIYLRKNMRSKCLHLW